MKVVSNSSVLIALGGIGRLDVLRAKFGQIHIPDAVWREVVEEGGGRPGSAEIARFDWVVRVAVADHRLASVLRQHLDDGEAEALTLAREQGAERVLLDERPARATAKAMGLVPLGTLGILVLGKRNGIIPNVRSEAERHLASGFRVRPEVLAQALAAAGE